MTTAKSRTRQAQRWADRATEHHLRGDLIEAEAHYRAALQTDPVLPDGLHGMGLIALARNMPAQAIALIGKASALRPNNALFTLNLGHALAAQGHLEEARAAFRAATLQDPDDPRSQTALAHMLDRLERPDEAVAAACAALRLSDDPAHTIGLQALLGRAASGRRDWTAAVRHLGAAVRENERDLPSWQALGLAYATAGRDDEAEDCLRRIVAECPDDPAALANLGAFLFERNRLEEALDSLRRSVLMGPPTAETSSNLGLALLALGYLPEAERALAAAAAAAPGQPGILNNHGTALLELGAFDAAGARFEQVEHDFPLTADAGRARFNRATLLLGTGRYAEGWPAFEARHALLGRDGEDLPPWDGSSGSSRPVVRLDAEQGLGDAIQFLRYVPAMLERAEIVLIVPEPLVRLARRSFGPGCIVLPKDAGRPHCDYRADLLSLPLLLRRNEPYWDGAYLAASPMPAGGDIGLCWSGNATYRFDRRRSLALGQLTGLAAPGRRFVSLQPERAGEQVPDGMMISRPALPDLAATADLIAGLDLVITVDTAVAHLAGALGKPVWLLNRFGGDWRWREANLDRHGLSLWYPSIRVFSQASAQAPGRAWEGVIARIGEALDRRS